MMTGGRAQANFKSLQDSQHQKRCNDGSVAEPYYPEGGWGFIVVFAAFTALMTQMGLIVSMGVYLEHIEEEFQSGAGISGWISSGCFAVLAFASPIACHVMNRLGCRITAMIGGAIMCTGFVCGTFANSAIQLFIFADIVAGLGGSMTHISATVVIGQYFNKRYALANGFAYTGQGVGIFIFPSILQVLIDVYGWRGCMLVQGALVLHISVAAALYRPVQRPSQNTHNKSKLERLRNEQKHDLVNENKPGGTSQGGTSQGGTSQGGTSQRSTSQRSTSQRAHCIGDSNHKAADSSLDECEQTDFSDETLELETVPASEYTLTSSPPVLDSVVSLTHTGVQTQFAQNESDENFTEKGENFPERELQREKSCSMRLKKLRNIPSSVLFIYAVFFFETFGYGGFFAHVLAKAHEIGVLANQATLALSMFGIGSLVGRVTHGYIIDRGILSPQTVNALSLVISGGASALVSLVGSSSGIYAGAFFAGMGSGWYLPLQQVLLRNIVGQSRLHVAYGYGLVFEGIGSLAGGYVIGVIRDVTGSYYLAFYFLCLVFLLGVVVFVIEYVFRKKWCFSKNRAVYTHDELATSPETPV